MSTPSPSPFAPGAVIGPYTLTSRLGGGGMGEVHAARSARGVVALKLITGAGIRDAETVARFRREGEILQALSHPAIVPVYEVGVDAASMTPFLAMEYVDGEDLERLVEREGPLPAALAVAIGLDLCGALAHAHACGVLHRDIKPANVLVPRTLARGYAILCDFGLSKRLGAGAGELITASDAILGTAHYMAPEQFADTRRASEKSDVWSLAMTLYVALAGRSPFEGLAGFDLLNAPATVAVPDVRVLVPDVPADVAAALRASLLIDPQQRLSLGALRRALRQTESAGQAIPRAPLSVPESVTSRRAPVAASRTGPPGLLDAVPLPRGTYTLMTSEGPFDFSGVDDQGRVVHVERIAGACADAGARAVLEREVTAFAQLRGERTVALVDFGELDGDAYVVCDAPDGRDLVREIEATGPIPYASALELFAESAFALEQLHALGIRHGRITPSSLHVRVMPHQRILVLHELGIGERVRAHLAALAQNRRPPSRDPRLDVLHFVTALHFAIVGQLPFGVPAPSPATHASSASSAPNASAVRPDAATFMAPPPEVRRALEALLKHAMQGFLASFRVVGDELSAMRRDASD